MSERGFTILELLVAAFIAAVVVIGAGSLYLLSARVERENAAEMFLQRQAKFVMDEMMKQIGGACACGGTTTPCNAPCAAMSATATCSGVPNSLQVTQPNGAVYCFHRDASGTGLMEDRPGGQNPNLLSGSPVTLSTTAGACAANTGGFCASLVTTNDGTPVAATVTLRLRFQLGTDSYQTMTFSSTIAARG